MGVVIPLECSEEPVTLCFLVGQTERAVTNQVLPRHITPESVEERIKSQRNKESSLFTMFHKL